MAASAAGSLKNWTPELEPEGADMTPVKAFSAVALVLAESYRPVPVLMRSCDSSTASATGSTVAPLVLTRPASSEGWEILVGCRAGLMSCIGACELPPETLDWLPIRVSSMPLGVWPCLLVAIAMPYIGLCGLFWVSFCDIAQITAPLVFVIVAGVTAFAVMPRRIAPSECHSSPRALLMKVLEVGTMLPGIPSLPNPAVDRKFCCPPFCPTSTSEPTRLAPPARSKQMKGMPEEAVGTLHWLAARSAWMSVSSSELPAFARPDFSSAPSHAG